MNVRSLRYTTAGLVLLHLVTVLLHGVAHEQMHVGLVRWQKLFIGGVIVAGPPVALAVLWACQEELGAVLLAVCMAGSSAFGICYHFLLSTPDNVFFMQQSGWGDWFRTTAVLLAVSETACCGWCVWMLNRRRHSERCGAMREPS